MKKILHILPDSLFTVSYLEMLEMDQKNEHQFILTDIGADISLNQKEYPKYHFDKISTFKFFDFLKLNRYLKKYKYDQLIIHSGYLNFLLLGLLLNKKVLKKSVLSLWGGSDSKKFVVKERNFIFKFLGLIYEFLRKKLYKRIPVMAAIIKDDYDNITKIYNLNCKYYKSEYPFISNILNNVTKEKNDSIKIQVCHSGSVECNTLEVLDALSKFKKQNILIYASVCYGNENYIQKIVEKGQKIFKDKFIPIYNLVPAREYVNYIASLDVLINNAIVQQGLGNINLALCTGVKVFLNKEGKLYNELTLDEKIIFHSNSISKLNLKELIKYDNKDKKINYDKSIINFDPKIASKLWEKIFNNE